MAISGVTDGDVETMATKIAQARRGGTNSIAALLGYAYKNPTWTLTDATGHVGSLAWTNLQGMVTIEWSDGKVDQVAASSSPKTHTFSGAGAVTAKVTSAGRYGTASVTLA